MLKIILIDDDSFAIDTLADVFPWEKLGYTLAGTFTQSPDALEYIRNNPVDVIITDIAMPSLSGLELVKICNSEFKNIKIILLSAYRDFEYAQTAVRYSNVIEYLTKPLDFNRLYELLKKALPMLSQNKIQSFTSVSDYNNRLDFFSELSCGNIKNEEELSKYLSKLKLDSSVSDMSCSLIHFHICDFDNYMENIWKHDRIQLYYAISNVIPNENKDGYYFLANYFSYNISWFIIHKKSTDVLEAINTFHTMLENELRTYFSMKIQKNAYLTWRNLKDLIKNPRLNYFETTDSDDAINSALRYMDEHYGENITLNDVARYVYMCPAYFSTYFKKNTGVNFITKLTLIRLEHASDLLRSTQMTINEICNVVGYHHAGNFYEKFKKQYKMTPNEYRSFFTEEN